MKTCPPGLDYAKARGARPASLTMTYTRAKSAYFDDFQAVFTAWAARSDSTQP
jgi:hypothetical protein